jgi:hypothetical protein
VSPALDFDHALAGNLRAARAAFARLGPALALDQGLTQAAQACRDQIAGTWELFRGLGVAAACGACASKRPGGCCFPEVALNHSREQLLANLLLGVELPEFKEIPDSCYFVGARGCKLMLRDSFCVNYFCQGLHERLGEAAMESLSAQVGREVLADQELERALAGWLAERGERL